MAKVTIKVISKDGDILYHKTELVEKKSKGEKIGITYDTDEAQIVKKQNTDSKIVTEVDHINLIKIEAMQIDQNNPFTLLKEVNNNNFDQLGSEIIKEITDHFAVTEQKQLSINAAKIYFSDSDEKCDVSSFIQKLTDNINRYNNQDQDNHFIINFGVSDKVQKELKYFQNRQENSLQDHPITDSNINLDLDSLGVGSNSDTEGT